MQSMKTIYYEFIQLMQGSPNSRSVILQPYILYNLFFFFGGYLQGGRRCLVTLLGYIDLPFCYIIIMWKLDSFKNLIRCFIFNKRKEQVNFVVKRIF